MSATLEIGKVTALTYAVVNAAGAPTDATVTLTITLPDLTTASPTVVHGVTGAYSAAYVNTQNGLHIAHWVASGAVTDVLTVYFYVGGLVSLTDVKTHLNIVNDTSHDIELQQFINGCIEPMENYCGTILPRTVTEWHDPAGANVMLRDERIVSVTSVTEYRGNASYDYTQITDPTGASTYTVLVDPSQPGKVTRIGPGGFDFPYTGRVRVIYIAGFATVPLALTEAAKEFVRDLWQQTQQAPGGYGVLPGDDLGAMTGSTPRWRVLASPYRRLPGMA